MSGPEAISEAAVGGEAERWTMIRRRDWPNDQGTIVPRGAPVPEPDEQLEVFEVVRAARPDAERAGGGEAERWMVSNVDGTLAVRRADGTPPWLTVGESVVVVPVRSAPPDAERAGSGEAERLREALRDPRLHGPLDMAAAAYLRERETAGTAGGAARRIVGAFLDAFRAAQPDAERAPQGRDVMVKRARKPSGSPPMGKPRPERAPQPEPRDADTLEP